MSDLNFLEQALCDIAALFSCHQVEYMVIGGLANARWGHARATIDIDITIWVADSGIEPLVTILQRDYSILVENPQAFINETRVLPLKAQKGQRIDLIFGALPFEKNAIERAVEIPVGKSMVKNPSFPAKPM